MTPVKLYYYNISGPARSAYLAAKLVGVPVEIVVVDLFKKEQLSESFLKINPQHCLPTIDDDGFIMWESRAIACYLADKYQTEEVYPKDLNHRALVNQRLFFDAAQLYPKIRAICHPIIFQEVTEIKQNLKDDLNTTLGFLEIFLTESKWVAGDKVTIADTTTLASISGIAQVGWDFSSFPNIRRWLKDCESLPGYEENLKGASAFAACVKRNLKE